MIETEGKFCDQETTGGVGTGTGAGKVGGGQEKVPRQ
jgi:hypothetical protein